MNTYKPSFASGQKIKAVASFGCRITEGKTYEVIKMIPPQYVPDARFTFPEYVVFLDDFGETCTCHTYRFELVE